MSDRLESFDLPLYWMCSKAKKNLISTGDRIQKKNATNCLLDTPN